MIVTVQSWLSTIHPLFYSALCFNHLSLSPPLHPPPQFLDIPRLAHTVLFALPGMECSSFKYLHDSFLSSSVLFCKALLYKAGNTSTYPSNAVLFYFSKNSVSTCHNRFLFIYFLCFSPSLHEITDSMKTRTLCTLVTTQYLALAKFPGSIYKVFHKYLCIM